MPFTALLGVFNFGSGQKVQARDLFEQEPKLNCLLGSRAWPFCSSLGVGQWRCIHTLAVCWVHVAPLVPRGPSGDVVSPSYHNGRRIKAKDKGVFMAVCIVWKKMAGFDIGDYISLCFL